MKHSWDVKKLGEVLKVQNGYAFNSKLFSTETGTPLIRIRDIKHGIRTETKYNGPYDKKYEVNAGDFLIGMDGEFGCYEWKGNKAILNQRVCRLQEFSKSLHPRFLFYGINKYLKAIEDVTAYATVKHISSKQIEAIEIPLPPLAEQQRIVAILDEAFAAIDQAKANTERNLKNANELFENTAQEIFTQKGIDWEEKILGEFATFRNGINYTKGSKGEKIKIVGVKDFQDSYWVPDNDLVEVSLDGKINETDLLQEGDILAVRSNGNPQLIGRTLLAGKINEKVSHSGFTIRIRLNSKIVNPNYLCHFLKIQQTRKTLVESGNGVGIRSLNQGSLFSLKIPFPKSLSEQEAIIDKVDSVAEQSQKLKEIYLQKIDDLEELKKSILQKAFTGELTTA